MQLLEMSQLAFCCSWFTLAVAFNGNVLFYSSTRNQTLKDVPVNEICRYVKLSKASDLSLGLFKFWPKNPVKGFSLAFLGWDLSHDLWQQI